MVFFKASTINHGGYHRLIEMLFSIRGMVSGAKKFGLVWITMNFLFCVSVAY